MESQASEAEMLQRLQNIVNSIPPEQSKQAVILREQQKALCAQIEKFDHKIIRQKIVQKRCDAANEHVNTCKDGKESYIQIAKMFLLCPQNDIKHTMKERRNQAEEEDQKLTDLRSQFVVKLKGVQQQRRELEQTHLEPYLRELKEQQSNDVKKMRPGERKEN